MAALDGAKAALKQAADAGAIRYAEGEYRTAETLVKSGWLELAHQRGRLAPFRNYHSADSLLSLAARTARDAQKLTLETIQNLDSISRAERSELYDELHTWRESLDGALENFQAERHWTSAEFSLNQADNLIRKNEYDEARTTIQKGRNELRNMESAVAEYANDEAQKIGVWRRWVRETLDKSRSAGTYALIIDKSAHKAHLIKAGELIRSYRCELGYNSARQKLFAGDGATPEGTYYVTKVKVSSKFHHALLINFPNQTDLRRLRDNKAKGIISRYARAGALIEIHGQGGKNRDWTDGCVAISDHDIDHLMQFASVGMPVTIVRRSDIWP
jgi:L,D-peptidoglycan transpeptidase YkuD (ErfK/YbiS/YcfS/YnhG family)